MNILIDSYCSLSLDTFLRFINTGDKIDKDLTKLQNFGFATGMKYE